jgi:hypothetical protein
MERVSIDVVGSFPRTRKGNQYILNICDCFTKWIETFAMKDQEYMYYSLQSWRHLLTNLYVSLEPQCSFILIKELISSQTL